jgi:coenzyme Q-binding protein COQ10
MPHFDTSRRVRHTAAQMFDLVADVERYPQFLPLCTALHVLQRTSENGNEVFVAEMQVGYKAIVETFKSRVTCDRPGMRILVQYVDGPFRYLRNTWSFHDGSMDGRGTISRVDFHIEYEFRNRMLALLMGSMFDQAFRRFASAFERRADEIYGVPPRSARRLA